MVAGHRTKTNKIDKFNAENQKRRNTNLTKNT